MPIIQMNLSLQVTHKGLFMNVALFNADRVRVASGLPGAGYEKLAPPAQLVQTSW